MLKEVAITSRLTPIVFVVACSVAMVVSACASRNDDRQAPTSALLAVTAPAVDKSEESLTVMNLLQWPLEGQAGVDRVSEALTSRMVFEPLVASQFHAEGPVNLTDGYVVNFVFLRKLSERIDIGVESKPCLAPELAQQATSAVKGEITQDSHGVDGGQLYTARQSGVLLRFTTTPKTYQCVQEIYISKIP